MNMKWLQKLHMNVYVWVQKFKINQAQKSASMVEWNAK